MTEPDPDAAPDAERSPEPDPAARDPPLADPEFARDVRHGLTDSPKHLPPKWLYDERGSELFEAITELSEYYLTDVEREIFREHADDIVAACAPDTGLVELGAGSAEKTSLLLDALVERNGHAVFCPIDISAKALEMARTRYETDPDIEVRPIQGEFVAGLAKLPDKGPGARLVAFIGSSIGNIPFDEQIELLASIREHLRPQDRFLLGTDMRKDVDTMLAAYDDDQGVTARFSKNLLARINRELDADFDLDAFAHRASFDPDKSAIVIHLESLAEQTVTIDALDLTVSFHEGELIHTEDSYKYTEAMVDDLVTEAGLDRVESWYDEDGWFGEHLLAVPDPA